MTWTRCVFLLLASCGSPVAEDSCVPQVLDVQSTIDADPCSALDDLPEVDIATWQRCDSATGEILQVSFLEGQNDTTWVYRGDELVAYGIVTSDSTPGNCGGTSWWGVPPGDVACSTPLDSGACQLSLQDTGHTDDTGDTGDTGDTDPTGDTGDTDTDCIVPPLDVRSTIDTIDLCAAYSDISLDIAWTSWTRCTASVGPIIRLDWDFGEGNEFWESRVYDASGELIARADYTDDPDPDTMCSDFGRWWGHHPDDLACLDVPVMGSCNTNWDSGDSGDTDTL